MAEYNLGTVQGTIEITYNGSGVDEATGDIERLNQTTQESGRGVGDVMDSAANKLLGFGAAGVAGFGVAAKTAIDFQQSMAEVGAVSGATAEQMTQLTDKARLIGKETSFSASEASLAMQELVKAGVSIPDVMNGAADATVALAAASGTDLATSAEIAANSLNVFNLKGEDMGHVADVIAGAANASSISVEDFGMSLSQSGVIAAQAGLSLDDTATAIVALGNAGIKGSDAGTGLKTMLMNLQPTTKEQAKLFDHLGITTNGAANQFYDANGKMKDLASISGTLSTALQGMGDDQKAAALKTMFGADAIRVAAILADTGAEGFRNLSAQMLGVKAADVAAARLNTLSGRMDNLKGSLEDVGITIGNILIPYLEKATAYIGQAVQWFSNLDQSTQQTIVKTAAVAVGLALMGGAFIKAVMAVQKLVQSLQIVGSALRLGSAFSAMGSGASSAASGIAAAFSRTAAATGGFITNFKNGMMGLDAAAGTAGGRLGSAFDRAHTAVQGAMTRIVTAVRTGVTSAATATASMARASAAFIAAWTRMAVTATASAARMAAAWVVGVVRGAATAIASMAVSVAAYIAGWVVMAVGAMASAVTMAAAWLIAMGPIPLIIAAVIALVALIILNWDKIKAMTLALWDWLFPYLKAIWEAIVAGATAVWNGLVAFFTGIWTAIKTVTQVVWDAIKAYFTLWWTVLTTVIRTGIQVIQTVISAAWNAIKAVTSAIWEGIKAVISAVWNAIFSTAQSQANAIRGFIEGAWNAIQAVTSAVWNAIVAVISAVWNTIQSVVTGAMNAVQSFISSAWEAIKSAVSTAITAVVETITTGFNNAVTFVSELPGKFMAALGNMGSLLIESGKALVRGFLDGIKAMVGAVVDAAKSVVQAARDVFPGSPAKVGPLSGKGWVLYSGHAMSEAFAQGMLDKKDDVAKAAETVAETANDPFSQMWQTVQQTGQDAMANVARALGITMQPVADQVKAADETAASSGATTEKPTFTVDDAIQMASQILGLVDTIESGFKNVKDLAELLVRGISGTKDIERVIEGVSSLIGTISSVASTVGSVVDGVAKIAAVIGAVIPGVGQVTAGISAFTGALGSVQSAISLMQQGIKIFGRIAGTALSFLAGGKEGALYGRVRTLIDTNDKTIKRWSDANAMDKRVTSYGTPSTTNNRTGVGNLNVYAGPGASASDIIDEAMFAVRAQGVGAYAS
jgi:TP901 family phage tail tape measure protein